jgi:SAM-dependent methyltransferase
MAVNTAVLERRRADSGTNVDHRSRHADRPLSPHELHPIRARRPGFGREPTAPFPNRPWRNWVQESLEVACVLRLLRVPPGARMLELGCGRGIGLVPLARIARPASLIGVDRDRDLLRHAERRLDEQGVAARLVWSDVRALTLPDESVDVVVDFGTCYHAGDPAAALAAVQRVLTPGGLFVHESPVAQFIAHPRRSTRCRLPWEAAPLLTPHHCAGLWSSRVKLAWAAGP